jgi:hypothetical protein
MSVKNRFNAVSATCTAIAAGILDERGIDHFDADDEFRECLDDMVHDLADEVATRVVNEGTTGDIHDIASGFATDINNIGALGQVSWLLAQGVTSVEIIEKLDEATLGDMEPG